MEDNVGITRLDEQHKKNQAFVFIEASWNTEMKILRNIYEMCDARLYRDEGFKGRIERDSHEYWENM